MGTAIKDKSQTNRINEVGVTDDIITGRGGLALFVRYLANINILPLLNESFGKWCTSAQLEKIIFQKLLVERGILLFLFPF